MITNKTLKILLPSLALLMAACERVEIRKERYPSGRLKARWEVTVSKDMEQKNGVYEEWYENKKSKLIVNYVDNKEHGVYRSYYPNSKIESEIYFIHGEMDGDFREWYDNGHRKREASYKKGKLHGTVQLWDSQGKHIAKASFKNGECKNGDCEQIATTTAYRHNL